jgi:prepilin-type N-terminal cleavage/methylation domain-containing protein
MLALGHTTKTLKPRENRGFTLLEMMTVLVIILILAVLFLPVFGKYQDNARRAVCVARLKGLYVATTGFLGNNEGKWPRIIPNMSDDVAFAKQWYEVLSPHGLGWQDLVCPSVQRRLGNPNVSDPRLHRMDYISTFFDARPGTPTKWANQPWFLERQDMHGGQLVILASGAVVDIREARRLGAQPQP